MLNHIGKIRALLRTGEPELHELEGEDEYDEDVEKEEPIYFTTCETTEDLIKIIRDAKIDSLDYDGLRAQLGPIDPEGVLTRVILERRERPIISWPSIPDSPLS